MSTIEELRLIESIVEASPAIIFRWTIREDWPVAYVSRNVEQLGYTQDEMLSGRVSWPAITHPDDLARLEKEVSDFLAGGTDSWSQTYRIRARDGTYYWMQDWNLLLRDERGVPREIQGIVIDITKQKTAEEQRSAVKKELEKTMAKVISGFLPICAVCKAIRDSADHWTPIEQYIARKSPVQFSHGYCPACAKRVLESDAG